jgi:hypothetical protein
MVRLLKLVVSFLIDICERKYTPFWFQGFLALKSPNPTAKDVHRTQECSRAVGCSMELMSQENTLAPPTPTATDVHQTGEEEEVCQTWEEGAEVCQAWEEEVRDVEVQRMREEDEVHQTWKHWKNWN